jgi:hypothetical protein
MIKLELPYREGLVQALLEEFGWDFRSGKTHPVTTGNCNCLQEENFGNHAEIAAEGTLEKGYYKNAAYVCSHCYPSSNPAMLEWTDETVTLTADEASSKPLRAMAVYYRVVQTENYVNADVTSALDVLKEVFLSAVDTWRR